MDLFIVGVTLENTEKVSAMERAGCLATPWLTRPLPAGSAKVSLIRIMSSRHRCSRPRGATARPRRRTRRSEMPASLHSCKLTVED